MKKKSMGSLLLSLFLIAIMVLTGCISPSGSEASTTAAPTKTSTPPSTTEAAKEPVKVTMFFSNTNTVLPEDYNASDNKYIQWINDYANVKLEVTQPIREETEQKFNLMLATGEILDVVVHAWLTPADKTGIDGGFTPLNDIIKNSPVLSKLHTDKAFEASKATDGNIYSLRSKDAQNNMVSVARIDLLDKYNGGKIPTTPEEWYAVAKAQKADNPSSVPFSAYSGVGRFDIFWNAYGINWSNPTRFYVRDGKVLNTGEVPLLKEAVEFHRKLYSEKLLDQGFITNQGGDWMARMQGSDLLAWDTPINSGYLGTMEGWKKENENDERILACVPHPIYPGVKPEYAYHQGASFYSHNISIAESAKDKDAATRVLEAFSSDEYADYLAWGEEGIHYNVAEGKKTKTSKLDYDKLYECHLYNFMFGFWPPASQAIRIETALENIATPIQDRYKNELLPEAMQTAAEELKVAGTLPFEFYTLSPEDGLKAADMGMEFLSIAQKAIISEISMQQFDKDIAAFVEKYRWLTDKYQAWYDENY